MNPHSSHSLSLPIPCIQLTEWVKPPVFIPWLLSSLPRQHPSLPSKRPQPFPARQGHKRFFFFSISIKTATIVPKQLILKSSSPESTLPTYSFSKPNSSPCVNLAAKETAAKSKKNYAIAWWCWGRASYSCYQGNLLASQLGGRGNITGLAGLYIKRSGVTRHYLIRAVLRVAPRYAIVTSGKKRPVFLQGSGIFFIPFKLLA